jgi:hypothetical protein
LIFALCSTPTKKNLEFFELADEGLVTVGHEFTDWAAVNPKLARVAESEDV